MKIKLPWFKHAELPFSMDCKNSYNPEHSSKEQLLFLQ